MKYCVVVLSIIGLSCAILAIILTQVESFSELLRSGIKQLIFWVLVGVTPFFVLIVVCTYLISSNCAFRHSQTNQAAPAQQPIIDARKFSGDTQLRSESEGQHRVHENDESSPANLAATASSKVENLVMSSLNEQPSFSGHASAIALAKKQSNDKNESPDLTSVGVNVKMEEHTAKEGKSLKV